MNKENIQDKSREELLQHIEELTKEQMNLKLQKSLGQLNSPHRLQVVRRNIARAKTRLHLL